MIYNPFRNLELYRSHSRVKLDIKANNLIFSKLIKLSKIYFLAINCIRIEITSGMNLCKLITNTH